MKNKLLALLSGIVGVGLSGILFVYASDFISDNSTLLSLTGLAMFLGSISVSFGSGYLVIKLLKDDL